MTYTLKVRKIGNSSGVILTKDILEKLHVSDGDSIFVVETSKGVELTAYDPVVDRQMKVARRVMKKHRDVLRKLAE